MTEQEMLEQHGTQLVKLKPSSLIAAAEADLKRRTRNQEKVNGRICKQYGKEHYAFHKAHVRAAKDVADLLRRAAKKAAKDNKLQSSGKRMTRILYSDAGLLREAAALLTAHGEQTGEAPATVGSGLGA